MPLPALKLEEFCGPHFFPLQAIYRHNIRYNILPFLHRLTCQTSALPLSVSLNEENLLNYIPYCPSFFITKLGVRFTHTNFDYKDFNLRNLFIISVIMYRIEIPVH